MSNIIQLRSVPGSCTKFGMPMNTLFARAESFGICFFYHLLLELYFCQNSGKRAAENEVCPWLVCMMLQLASAIVYIS